MLASDPGIRWCDAAGVSMPMKIGDHALLRASAGVWIEVDEERLLVCRVGELFGLSSRLPTRSTRRGEHSCSTSSSPRLATIACRWRRSGTRSRRSRATYLLTHHDIPVPRAGRLTVGGRLGMAPAAPVAEPAAIDTAARRMREPVAPLRAIGD